MAAGLQQPERGDPGGSLGLVGLIDEHPHAFAYEWRTRFGQALDEVGESMTWGEAVSLTRILCQDPSSWVAASMSGWEHPVSRDALVLMDLYDLTHVVNSKRRPKPYPRPWAGADATRVAKNELTQEETLAALRYAGHDL